MTYIKEYGTRRTFTNYFYVLTHHNFRDVQVLPSILDSKHAEPVDYRAWLKKEIHKPRFKTEEYLARIRDVQAHLDQVRFAVLIKNPYAWLLSLLELRNSQGNKRVFNNEKKHRSVLRRFNEKYTAWKALIEREGNKAVMFRYGDVLVDPKQPLRVMEKQFGLKRKRKRFENIGKKVNQCERIQKSGFKKKDFYLNQQYFHHPRYTASMFKNVTQLIDWKLMAWYGYHKEQAKKWGFK